MKNAVDAEDAVQSVFLKLLQANVAFENPEHEMAWFITTAKNHCKDIFKSWWKRQRVDFDTLPERFSREEDSPAEEIIAKLLALPEKYRVVLYLYYLEEYSVKEISMVLERRESTIRSQLQRGREKLKSDLGGIGFGQEDGEQSI